MKISRQLVFLTAAILLLPLGAARAAIHITITKGNVGAVPIAIVPFGWQGAQPLPTDIAQVVGDDLTRSGRFKAFPRADMLEKPTQPNNLHFGNWRAVGVDDVVIGHVAPADNGGYTIEFQLFDVYTGQQLLGYRLGVPQGALRERAHRVSDLIYQKLTGERGAFATRIAFVESQRKAGKTHYALIVADADGHNPQTIVQSSEPILSPSWSPDGQRLAYTAFSNHQPGVYVQTLATGKRVLVSQRPGLNSAPAFSPDGSKLAMVLSSQPGNPDIYIYNLKSGHLLRLTRDTAIDTEPSWTPDSRNIAFTSDRGGSAQIYEEPADGGGARRLTYDGSYNAAPQVSPDGKSIVMVHREQGHLHIAVMDIASGDLRVLTNGDLDKSPSYAPNGSMIMYAGVFGGKNELAAVSSDGSVHQQLSSEQGEISDPAWSPYLSD